MKKNTLASFIAFALSAIGLKELPKDADGKLALDPEQDATLQKEFGVNYEAFKKKANEHLAAEIGADAEKEAAREKANADLLAALGGQDQPAGEEKPTIEATAKKATEVITEQKATIETLAAQPEADEVVRNIGTNMAKAGMAAMIMATSASQLFGMPNKEFSRATPWNNRAALELTGKTAAVTDFSDSSTIARLNDDLKEYYVKNPQVLRDLRKDRFGLPVFWPKVFNVVDMLSDAVIDVANVTQGRKPEWSPNPDFFIGAELRKNYPVQIDIEFSGYQLQQLETSWINSLFDMDGSSPYKMSFVAYLVKKIDDQARLEDRISSINGVYVFKPLGIKAKGYFLNRQNGLRYQLYNFRDLQKKVAPYVSPLGMITAANAYDYIQGMTLYLPNDIRMVTGMKWYLSQEILNWYREGYKQANGTLNNYEGNTVNSPEGYPNLEFVVLTDFEGCKAMFITDENNIEILEDVPNEKSIYRFEYLKRNTYIHADYKQTAAFVFAGFKLPKDSNFLGQAQYIWMNDAPMFSENFYVPMYGNLMGGEVEIAFNRIKTDINLLSDIVTFKSTLSAGQIVKIVGNVAQLTNSKIKKKTVGNGGNLDLTEDFDPKLGGTLTLLVTADGFKELSRTDAPVEAAASSLEITGTAVDANLGAEFKYTGASAVTLATILNGVEGKEIKIYGQATNTLTVANVVGKILISGAAAVLDGPAKSITLKKFDGVWTEIARA